MSIYRAGTVSATEGSNIVTGTDVDWSTVREGMQFTFSADRRLIVFSTAARTYTILRAFLDGQVWKIELETPVVGAPSGQSQYQINTLGYTGSVASLAVSQVTWFMSKLAPVLRALGDGFQLVIGKKATSDRSEIEYRVNDLPFFRIAQVTRTINGTPTECLVIQSSANNGATWLDGFTLRRDGGLEAIAGTWGDTFPVEASVASGSTVDLGAISEQRVAITGTTNIQSFGATGNKIKFVRVVNGFTVAHNAAISCPGGRDLQLPAGSFIIVESSNTGLFRIVSVLRGDGSMLIETTNLATSGTVRNRTQPTVFRIDQADARAAGGPGARMALAKAGSDTLVIETSGANGEVGRASYTATGANAGHEFWNNGSRRLNVADDRLDASVPLVAPRAARSVNSASSSGDRTLTVLDNGGQLTLTGTVAGTVATAAPGSWPVGVNFTIRNTSTEPWTIDPDASVQIGGAATYSLLPGLSVVIAWNGTSFDVVDIQRGSRIDVYSPNAVASQAFVLPAGYTFQRVNFALLLSAATNLLLRLSTDGTTFESGASAYRYSTNIARNGTPVSTINVTTSGILLSSAPAALAPLVGHFTLAFARDGLRQTTLVGASQAFENGIGQAALVTGGDRVTAGVDTHALLLVLSGNLTGTITVESY